MVVAIGVVLIVGVFPLEETRKNRAQMQCVANLKQMDGAVLSWALENKKAVTDTHSLSDAMFLSYLKGSTLPLCPSGGTYTSGTNIGDVPRCSVHGHELRYKTSMGGYPR